LNRIPRAFIDEIPKTDLHVHLDGSLRIPSLIEMARERGVELPSYTEEGLRELVFKDRYADLGEYLRGFAYTCRVLRDKESLERAAYELAVDCFSENVRYIEPRMAPQLHIGRELETHEVLHAMDRGYRRACAEFNRRPEIRDGSEPPFAYGMIVCAMRLFGKNFSPYYRSLLEVQAYAPEKDVFGMASLEMARAAVRLRDDHDVAIVGFDLAGQEDGYPAHDHERAYAWVHRNFLRKTVHAGEAYGPESIYEAITNLHADRIGHGYYLFDTGKIRNPAIQDRERYVRNLAEYIADHRVTIEICLTSNLQTNPTLKNLSEHPFRKMLDAKISTTLCTDNRLVSNTTVGREIQLAIDEIGLSPRQLRECVFHGFKRSFMPFRYLEKRDYVRKVINHYERLERKHGIKPDNEEPVDKTEREE
jgi:adenosine deaminase